MKYLNYLAGFLLITTTLTAQEIKFNNSIVYVGDKPAFSFAKKGFNNELYLYKLNTKEELVHLLVDTNGTETMMDDGKKIIFVKQNITIQAKNFRTRKWDFLIDLLVKEKVIDLNGEVNIDNLNRFKAKYDENNVNQTMR